MKNKQACVYCASSSLVHQKYFLGAEQIAKILVEEKHTVIYGGGSHGLMGALADKVLELKGKIIGVIPGFMKEVEWDHPGVEEMIITKDMAERKKRFLVDTDVIIALPGGCGTLEEIAEAISLKKLSQIKMPIVIFNQDGFYNDLISLFNNFIDQKFMGSNHSNLYTVIDTPEELRTVLNNPLNQDDYQLTDALVQNQ